MSPLVFGLLGKVIESVGQFLDPTKKAEAELAILRLHQDAAFKEIDTAVALAKQQNDVNLEESKSESLFKSGWRPFVGWVFGVALLWQYLVKPGVETFYIFYTGHAVPVPLPSLDNVLWELGFGLLGLGALRTTEKIKGVAK